jgi:hypothetical protein
MSTRPRARFCLTDAEVSELAKQAMIIEKHYGRPMDIEWAKDGDDGKLYIVQARPETVKSRTQANVMERYLLKETGTVLAEGRAIGQRSAPARCASSRTRPKWTACSRATCWFRHDRPGLGTGDEARQRHRHQPWRPYLPRGDHRP